MIEKLKQVTRLQGELLRENGIGHHQWYAENLVAIAFDGRIMPTNCKNYDVDSSSHGRIQVKSRVNGTDGKTNNQNRTQFGKYAPGSFDLGAIVMYTPEYRISGAKLLAASHLTSIVRAAGHVSWVDICGHPQAVDISDCLREISGET